MAVKMMTEPEVRSVISMSAAIDAVRRALHDLADGRFLLPPRTHHGDGRYLVMTAYHRLADSTVVKSLSLETHRVPAIVGTTTWTSAARADVLVADAAPVTALRTGAIVGVATDALAATDARRLVLYGAGGQAADQVRAVHAVRPLSHLTIVTPTPERARRLADLLEPELPDVRIVVRRLGQEDLAEAQIICCATPASAPLFRADDLPSEVHVNAIGSYRPSMRELPDELLDDAVVLAVDDVPACLAESGELIRALGRGMSTGRPTALHDLLDSSPPGGRTVFKTVGLAIQDWAVMHLLADAVLRPATPPV